MKKFSKIISLILSVILTFVLVVPAFAADTDKQTCPVIFIPGFATSHIYTDKDNPVEEIQPISSDVLLEIVKETLIPSLIIFSADRDYDKLASSLCDAINSKFSTWFNNLDGSAMGNSGVLRVYPEASSVNSSSDLRFDYDWRGDPIAIAAELNDYINYITQSCGCDKVSLTAHSLGNVITLTYLSIYGFDKVQGAVFDTPAIDGVDYIGDLMCGEFEFTDGSVDALFRLILGSTEYEQLLSSVADAFGIAGIPGMLALFLNDILEKIAPTVFRETLVPVFGTWPTIWAMTPDDRIDESMDYIFSTYFTTEDSLVLRSKVEAYNTAVRENKYQTLLAFDEVARVAVISRYGTSSIPITSSWNNLSDGVIDTKHSSLGATTASYGEILSSEYLEGKDSAYISPDKTVDASTCLFPEKTWFIKNLGHQDFICTQVYYESFLFAQQEPTTENHALSRFSILNPETGRFDVDESVPDPVEKLSPWQVLIKFLKSILAKFLELFKK